MKISTIVTTAAVALFATTAFATAASAQTAQVKVGYADLNLGSVAGQDVLANRIDAAARKVCGVNANERLLAISTAAARCHHDAVAQTRLAIASANAPVLASR